MKIQVRPKHIREAEKTIRDCPVALAFKAHGLRDVQVGVIWGSGRRVREELAWRLPITASEFIKRFDRGDSVEPFTFEMERV